MFPMTRKSSKRKQYEIWTMHTSFNFRIVVGRRRKTLNANWSKWGYSVVQTSTLMTLRKSADVFSTAITAQTAGLHAAAVESRHATTTALELMKEAAVLSALGRTNV